MGLFSKSKREVNIFASNETDLRGGTKLDAISALELDRLELTKQMEELAVQYSKISGIKSLRRRRYKVGRAPNDYKRSFFDTKLSNK